MLNRQLETGLASEAITKSNWICLRILHDRLHLSAGGFRLQRRKTKAWLPNWVRTLGTDRKSVVRATTVIASPLWDIPTKVQRERTEDGLMNKYVRWARPMKATDLWHIGFNGECELCSLWPTSERMSKECCLFSHHILLLSYCLPIYLPVLLACQWNMFE